MKRFFVFLVILIFKPLRGNDIIKNPEKPLSMNYGRVITVERTMTITDENDDYFLKKPMFIK